MNQDFISQLNLQPLEGEGGYFVEVYRARDKKVDISDRKLTTLQQGESLYAKNDNSGAKRDLYTTIYYLMDKTNAPHVNKSDHIHFYHYGGPIKYYWLDMEGKKLETAVLGSNIAEGQRLHLMVPGGTLKWAEVLDDGINHRQALISECTVPGFEFDDRKVYSEENLKSMFPTFWEDIKKGFS